MVEQALNLSLVGFAVVMLVAVGQKKRWGWLVGAASEFVWLALAIFFWQSVGVVVLSFLYGGLYLYNFRVWGRA